jgi:outer membrane protein assembly factor BamB
MKHTLLLGLCLSLGTYAQAQNWPSFRGPNASGVAEGRPAPTSWNVEKSANIKWRARLPGLAHSSPVVWGDRLFVTTAVSGNNESAFKTKGDDIAPVKEDTKHAWRIYCLDKASGRVVWDRTAHEGVPRVKRHLKASQANATPATDGRYVVAVFGSEGLYCYDTNGKFLWKQDLGVLDPGLHEDATYQWGHSSSPVIYKDLVIVQCDGHAQSYVAAYDLKDGRRVWRAERGERPSWSTPLVYEGKGRTELVTNGPRYIRGYDPATGKELWRLSNNDLVVQVPTPFVAHGMIFVTGGWPGGRPISTIRPGAAGDISLKEGESSGPNVAWRLAKGGPYVPTPIVYGDYLYVCNDRGVLTCHNARTGEQVYQQRVGGQSVGFSASPVAADGKLYLASEDGDVYVIKAGPQYELLSVNPVGEPMMATPAISDGMIFIRGRNHLFCVAAASR